MSHEIITALVQIGLKNVRLAKRVTALEARGVTRQDILAVANHLTQVEGHAPKHAVAMIDAVLDSEADWPGYVQRARAGVRTATAVTSDEPLRMARPPKNTAHDERIKEYLAHGCATTDEALRYEQGGYHHERIVGDGRAPAEIAKDMGLDPWDVVQMASAWAQRFGGGTAALRRSLLWMARGHDAAARLAKAEERARHLEQADALDGLLRGVPEKVAQEAGA